jgi:hypothetical protein
MDSISRLIAFGREIFIFLLIIKLVVAGKGVAQIENKILTPSLQLIPCRNR